MKDSSKCNMNYEGPLLALATQRVEQSGWPRARFSQLAIQLQSVTATRRGAAVTVLQRESVDGPVRTRTAGLRSCDVGTLFWLKRGLFGSSVVKRSDVALENVSLNGGGSAFPLFILTESSSGLAGDSWDGKLGAKWKMGSK